MPPSWKTVIWLSAVEKLVHEASHLFSSAFGLGKDVNVEQGPAFLDNPIDECATGVNLGENTLSWLTQ